MHSRTVCFSTHVPKSGAGKRSYWQDRDPYYHYKNTLGNLHLHIIGTFKLAVKTWRKKKQCGMQKKKKSRHAPTRTPLDLRLDAAHTHLQSSKTARDSDCLCPPTASIQNRCGSSSSIHSNMCCCRCCITPPPPPPPDFISAYLYMHGTKTAFLL